MAITDSISNSGLKTVLALKVRTLLAFYMLDFPGCLVVDYSVNTN